MHILLVSATPFEIAPIIDFLGKHFETKDEINYQKGKLNIELLITGVGLTNTAYQLGKAVVNKKPDLAINAGIAGALNTELEIGQVVQVVSEQVADLGVEEADGRFTSVHDLGLIGLDEAPFQKGCLVNEAADAFAFLPKTKAISVNKVHGTNESIAQLRTKYQADIESMEGAAFFLICLSEQIPFLQIRSISNYVEVRNRENWNIPLAIEALNKMLIQILDLFDKMLDQKSK